MTRGKPCGSDDIRSDTFCRPYRRLAAAAAAETVVLRLTRILAGDADTVSNHTGIAHYDIPDQVDGTRLPRNDLDNK